MSIVHLKRATIDSQHTIQYYNRHKGKEASKNLKLFNDNIAETYELIFNTPIRDAEELSILELETIAFEKNDKPNSIVNDLYNLDFSTYRNFKIHPNCTIPNIEKGVWTDDKKNAQNKSDPQLIRELRSIFNNLGMKTTEKNPHPSFNVKYIFENNRQIIADIGYYRFITHVGKQQQSVATWLKDIKSVQRIIRLALTNPKHVENYQNYTKAVKAQEKQLLKEPYKKLKKIEEVEYEEPMSHNLYVKYSAIAYDIKTFFVDFLSENNTLNKYEYDNYIPFETVLQITSDAKEKQQKMIFTVPTIPEGKRQAYAKETMKEHFKFLALACYVWTPPVRHEIFSMKIRHEIVEFPKNAKEKDLYDYVYVPSDKTKLVQYVFHLDKKKHGYVKYTVGFVDNRLVVNSLGLALSNAIRVSLDLYPRTVLLPQIYRKQIDTYNPDVSMKESTGSNWLAEMGGDRRLGTSVLRSSFATYRSTLANYNARKDDSTKMRNSVHVMLTNYVKIITDPVLRHIVKKEPIDDSAKNNNEIDLVNPAMKAIMIKQEPDDDDDSPQNLNRIDLIPKKNQSSAFRILSNVLRPLDFSNVQIPIQQPVIPEKSVIQKEKDRFKKYYEKNSTKILDQQAEYKAKNKDRIRIQKNTRVYNSDLVNGRVPNKQLQIKDELYQDPVTKLWKSKVLERMKE
jgi:hypothetical protein